MREQVVYGIHAVKALLASKWRKPYKILLNRDRKDQIMQQIETMAMELKIPIQLTTLKALDQQYGEVAHQGVIALAHALPGWNESDLDNLLESLQHPALILMLDSVTDPHNLGACLRTADAAGVDCVIIPKDKSATMSAVVSKVACGAAESVPIVKVTNLVRTIDKLKQAGVWIYGATGETEQLVYQLDTTTAMALVMGAEGSGLRRLTKDHCDGLFSIPMLGCVSSLNVSVATGIALYEIVRQRNYNA